MDRPLMPEMVRRIDNMFRTAHAHSDRFVCGEHRPCLICGIQDWTERTANEIATCCLCLGTYHPVCAGYVTGKVHDRDTAITERSLLTPSSLPPCFEVALTSDQPHAVQASGQLEFDCQVCHMCRTWLRLVSQ
jgi:hypothetical protein